MSEITSNNIVTLSQLQTACNAFKTYVDSILHNPYDFFYTSYKSTATPTSMTLENKSYKQYSYEDAPLPGYYRIVSYAGSTTDSVELGPNATGTLNLTYADPSVFYMNTLNPDVDVDIICNSSLEDFKLAVRKGNIDTTNLNVGQYNNFWLMGNDITLTQNGNEYYSVAQDVMVCGVSSTDEIYIPFYAVKSYYVFNCQSKTVNGRAGGYGDGFYFVSPASATGDTFPDELTIRLCPNITEMHIYIPTDKSTDNLSISIIDCENLVTILNGGMKVSADKVTISGCPKLVTNELIESTDSE